MTRNFPAVSELAARDQKLEQLKIVVSQMGHSFKNLLVPQLGYATLIREEAGADSPVLPFAVKLQDASRKADEYLEAVLTAVRPQRRYRPRMFDLADVVRQAAATWKSALPSNPEITVCTELSPCNRLLDDVHWQEAVLQLLKNCQDSLPSGGRIRVTLGPELEMEHPGETLGLSGTEIFRLQVDDTGSGMSEEAHSRCFEPFFSARAKNPRTGIGLTLVHSVVRLHGGQIVIDSENEKGTSVKIWLPMKILIRPTV